MFEKLKQVGDMKIGGGMGGAQPYSNTPLSFGQSFNTTLSAKDSGLASPPPLLPYSRCASVPRG
jgi:hypothetical protein